MKEINVYVIENEQPFENWFGTWAYFKNINSIPGFYVENNKGKMILVDKKNVFESETNLPIDEFLKILYTKENLKLCGLEDGDIDLFIKLLDKIKIPEDWIESFYQSLEGEDSIPFEGGMGFSEALVGMKESLNY